jgi:L,D-transpeptidase ErfK/SrfK
MMAPRWRYIVPVLPLALLAPAAGAHAESFALAPDQALVGAPDYYVTGKDDTLLDVARQNDLGYSALMTVNAKMDPWLPGDGKTVTLPKAFLLPDGPRKGIVIDLAAQRLYYFPPDGKTVETYPIGTGDQAGMTPTGSTRVTAKTAHPAWYPTASIRKAEPDLPAVVPAGPDNPLGDYALRLGWPSYLVHGTNKPYGVGRNVSHGCIRLYPEDIERLFHEVKVGTPVRVVDKAMRIAWANGELYVSLAPTHDQMVEISENQPMSEQVPSDLFTAVAHAAGEQVSRVDWKLVAWIGQQRPSMPIAVTESADGGPMAMSQEGGGMPAEMPPHLTPASSKLPPGAQDAPSSSAAPVPAPDAQAPTTDVAPAADDPQQ